MPTPSPESSTAPALPLRLLLLDRSCCSPDRAPLRRRVHPPAPRCRPHCASPRPQDRAKIPRPRATARSPPLPRPVPRRGHDASRGRLVAEVTAGFKGDVGVVPRQFLREFVNQLDLVDDDADYEPMREYGFKPAELKPEEELAIKGQPFTPEDGDDDGDARLIRRHLLLGERGRRAARGTVGRPAGPASPCCSARATTTGGERNLLADARPRGNGGAVGRASAGRRACGAVGRPAGPAAPVARLGGAVG
jgi:hypothetical protein